jgi:hypothetical protein
MMDNVSQGVVQFTESGVLLLRLRCTITDQDLTED